MITETDIYNNLLTKGLVDVTIYKTKPHDSVVVDGNYIFVSKISENVDNRQLNGIYFTRSRFSFTIVCKKELSIGESSVDILNGYLQNLINIYDNGCNSDYNSTYQGRAVTLFDERDRPMLVADFIFIY